MPPLAWCCKVGKSSWLATPYPAATSRTAPARYDSAGALDPTFGAGGKVMTNFDSAHDAALAVALQADGKIIAAGQSQQAGGNFDFALARYTGDGVLDGSFGSGGKVITDFGTTHDAARSVAL